MDAAHEYRTVLPASTHAELLSVRCSCDFLSRLVVHWSFLLCICSRTELGHSGHCELVVDPNAAPLLAARRWPLIVASVPLRSGSIRGSTCSRKRSQKSSTGSPRSSGFSNTVLPLMAMLPIGQAGAAGAGLPYPT